MGEPHSPPPADPPDDDDGLDPEELLSRATRAVEFAERAELQDDRQQMQARLATLEEYRRRFLMLLDSSRMLNRIGEVEELLDRILESALELSNADRAYLLQRSSDGTLRTLACRTRDGSEGDPDALADISHTILDRVLDRGKTLYVDDAQSNPDFMAQRSVRELSLRTVACVPLPGPNGVSGALYVDSHRAAGLLEEEGVEILEGFAGQAAIALETAAHRHRLEETAKTLETANESLKRALGERTRFDEVLGDSPAMNKVLQVLERVLDRPVTVLLQGETGTGKELVAQALHFNGKRREGNFIPVNCGALPENLLESELFGYRKGAFTGAERDHVGLVEAANGGTLFLDEIGELTSPLQAKLLRVIQENEVRRIGENEPRKVDVRFVAATHHDLAEGVRNKQFREDLYYRINVVNVTLPPLRERGEDVLLLTENFLARARERMERPGLALGAEARRALMGHDWPGNVRELMNAVERAAALSQDDILTTEDLLPGKAARVPVRFVREGTLKETLNRAEEAAIKDALLEAGGVISQAARLLGVSRQHLHTRIKKLGLREK